MTKEQKEKNLKHFIKWAENEIETMVNGYTKMINASKKRLEELRRKKNETNSSSN